MHNFRSALLVTLILFVQVSFAAHPDTVVVNDISVKPDVVSGNIHGAEVTVLFKKRFAMKKNEPAFQSYHFMIQLFDEADKPVGSINAKSKYDRNGHVTAENMSSDMNIVQTGSGKFFIPYYILKLKEGQHKVKIKLRVGRWDTAKADFDTKKVVTLGPHERSFSINKPQTRTVKLCCSGVRVHARNAKGSLWDFGSVGAPDLIYKIMLESAQVSDALFVSTEMQNATSAAWIDMSSSVTISEGDKITIGIFDNDTVYDDEIGNMEFTFDELLTASSSAKEFHFGLVEFCTLKASEVK